MTTPSDPSKRINPIKAPEGESTAPRITPGGEKFQSYMKESGQTPTSFQGSRESVSPIELPRGANANMTTPTAASLLNQVQSAQQGLGQVQEKLKTPNLSFKRAHESLLTGKLSDASSHLRTAATTLGAPANTPIKLSKNPGPVEKFLGYITDGQNQLASAKTKLQEISAKGTKMKPADFLLVQIKVAQAQQEIEYSSVFLSKVIDALKQILGTQL